MQPWSVGHIDQAAAHVVGGGGGPYTAQGVHFDHTNDWFARGGALSSVSDGKQGICSFWFDFAGLSEDNDNHVILEDSTFSANGFHVFRTSTKVIKFDALNSGNTCFSASSNSTFDMGISSGWHHVIAAWDLASGPTFQLYIDGASDISGSPTTGNFNVPWTTPTDWFVGARSGFGISFNGDLADFYLNTATYLDISNSTNLQKFRSAGGAPVNLGATGATPTGSQPTIFLSGATASWYSNKGNGGGFTPQGSAALTNASTNPP